MSQQVMSETAHVADFDRMIERLTKIVEIENEALKSGNIHTLQSLQHEKGRLSFLLRRKWQDYKSKLKNADGKRQNAFSRLSDKIDYLKEVMQTNAQLLTVAKVRSANRIEAGMQAWRRHHEDNATSYGGDGCSEPAQYGPNITTSRLI
ncbi:hypothetical protein [Terasakiella sp.]|uniref:hypothetical protein n=1 Tax=Terasakiella sp. TaxID=2034861 RepID=UPI003AA92DBD